MLTPGKREVLLHLRQEAKFGPNDYPPLGYAGIPSLQDKAVAVEAVDSVVDGVIARPNGPLPAKLVIKLISKGMKKARLLDTEDGDRAQGYMLEIWYDLGFKGATGLFVYGSAFRAPPGYGEPLPPGWATPDRPRPIG